MIKTVDFVKENITIRKSSFSNNHKLFNSILLSESIYSYNSIILQNISSKSFIGDAFITNRLEGLEYFVGKIIKQEKDLKIFN